MKFPKELNIPNTLTMARILLGFLFLYFLFYVNIQSAVFIFLVAVITDALDGFIARKYGTVTNLGKFLDGFADKFFMLIIVYALLVKFNIPLLFVLMILTRDILVIIGSVIVMIRMSSWDKIKKLNFSARKLGKITTFIQVVTVLMIFFEFKYISVMAYSLSVLGILAVSDYYDVWKKHMKFD